MRILPPRPHSMRLSLLVLYHHAFELKAKTAMRLKSRSTHSCDLLIQWLSIVCDCRIFRYLLEAFYGPAKHCYKHTRFSLTDTHEIRPRAAGSTSHDVETQHRSSVYLYTAENRRPLVQIGYCTSSMRGLLRGAKLTTLGLRQGNLQMCVLSFARSCIVLEL